ncbi:MAG TPA: DUF711 family protein [Candidatus Cloacimonetes bacterium]|nr:DUF711 family protein [Candidatus Cloacimonadota bacterium]
MKIRTITHGISLEYPFLEADVKEAAQFNLNARKMYEDQGYEVQEPRITTNCWPEFLGHLSEDEIIRIIQNFEAMSKAHGVEFTSIGTVKEPKYMDMIPKIIQQTESVSTTITIVDQISGMCHEALDKAAHAIKEISETTEKGYGNFRFAAIANCPPEIPFYPASYHIGKKCFSLGLECSDVINMAFEGMHSIGGAQKNLERIFTSKLKPIEDIGLMIQDDTGVEFKGIDVSIAPSLEKDESIAFGFEKLGLNKFGEPGTLSIAAMVTGVLKLLPIRKCGYNGLMLPILEDVGLAERCGDGLLNVQKILAYSAVCGTGLDCIPLPGDISEKKLYNVLYDVASLSLKLDKPLSARLFPVLGKHAGDYTDFNSPFLTECKILDM